MKPSQHHLREDLNDNSTTQFFENFSAWAISRRLPILLTITIITGILSTGLPKIKVDNANELWFIQGDQTVERYHQFQDQFGSDKFIFFLLQTENVFSTKTLSQLEALSTQLESISYKEAPAFSDITHLGNVPYVQSSLDGIEVIEMTEGLGDSPVDIDELKRRAQKTDLYEGLLFSSDGKAAGLIAQLANFPNDGQFHHILTAKLREILKQSPLSEYDIQMAGGPILDADMDRVSVTEAGLFGGLGLLLNILMMFFLFRNKAGIVIPMGLVGLTIIWTFGLMGFFEISINIVHVILPLMLITVAISDAVHILGEYQLESETHNRNQAIQSTMGKVSLACLLTTITTAIGMLSLTLAPIPPIRALGLFAAIGVCIAFLITLFFVPAALSYTGLPPKKNRKSSPTVDRWNNGLLGIGNWTTRHAKVVVVGTVIILGLSIYGTSLIEIETDFVSGFRKSFPTRQAFTAIDSTLGGSSSLQMVIDTKTEGGVKEPEFLRKLDQLAKWVKEEYSDGVKKTISVADLIKNMNQTLHDDAPSAYVIPETRAAVAQELMLYENSDPDGLFASVTDDFRIARLDARTTSGGTHAAAIMMGEVLNYAQDLFGPGVEIHYTGISHMFVRMAQNLSQGQIRSYIAAFGLIFLMMILVLKSLWLGTLSMVPNLLPVLCAMAVMGYTGVPLDFITLLVACIAIGIAVDDTIHFLVRFRQEYTHSQDYHQAIRQTLTSVGRAMLFTTLILCAGFSMFAASVMINVAIFGGLLTLTLAVALLSDFVIMPAILVVFTPLGAKNANASPKSNRQPNNKTHPAPLADTTDG